MNGPDPRGGPPPAPGEIHVAARRIAPHIHRTPVMRSASLDRMTGANLFLKCENLQKVGAFKARGATNAVLSLSPEEAERGVATHSSGNHAAALARAAAIRGVPAHVVMPRTAPPVKRAAVEGYGARVVACDPTLAAREEALAEVVRATGATFIHPYDDARVVAGQGTAALELLEQVEGLDSILTPLGGGGLLSGACLAVAGVAPGVEVFGVEPAAADDARRSLLAGEIIPSEDPETVADGLRTSLSPLTFGVIREHVAEVLTVEEVEIVAAMRLLWERTKLVVEASAAVVAAAVLSRAERFRGRRVGLVLSGGNVDLDRLPWLRAGRGRGNGRTS